MLAEENLIMPAAQTLQMSKDLSPQSQNMLLRIWGHTRLFFVSVFKLSFFSGVREGQLNGQKYEDIQQVFQTNKDVFYILFKHPYFPLLPLHNCLHNSPPHR